MARRAEGWRLELNTSGFWRVRFTHAGKRHQISTGKRDPDEATKCAKAIYSEVVSGKQRTVGHARRDDVPPLDELAAEWLADMESALDETTVYIYGGYIGAHWEPFFGSVDRITSQTAESYWRDRLRSVKRKSVLKELAALRGFLRWCKANNWIDAVPEVSSPPQKATGTPDISRTHKAAPILLQPAEVEAIIRHMPAHLQPRMVVAWETALRPGTLRSIATPGDYVKGSTHLRIRDEADKARYGRSVPLTARARETLDAVCPEVGLIFGRQYLARPMKVAAKLAGLDDERAAKVSPYDLRHSRLTEWARTGQLKGIAFMAGHKQLTTTNMYLHPTQRDGEELIGFKADRIGPVPAQARTARKRSKTKKVGENE